ncbi:4-oxalocrotonate tautomerase family enzyme [Curtobacterium sp. PhB130]|uniref:2-hydroxymuconate tautomerase n=1 Tax=Bacteria TaxID=2 RepID=UPI000F4BBADB|nr:2-hydroxymuconate tautomerase [Curtobacterium sp. PhB130]ROS75658.1 4-oxalocrotonate tautomerase family enzyme [Curtobacterium sp. PhB130]
MPIIHVDIVPELMRGDRQVQYKTMAAGITDAFVASTGAPVESVHVLITEVSDTKYSVGGVLLHEKMASPGVTD